MINQEMKNLGQKASDIRELFEYGKKRKQEIGEENVFDFSIGNPSVPSPKVVNETLINLINTVDSTTLHGYTSAAGDLKVRYEIVKYLNQKYCCYLDENLMYLTVGAAASLTISLNAILNNDDEVILFAPYFPEYKVFVEKAGGIVKIVNPIEKTFIPSFEALEKTITSRTKLVIINSPNNPTGVVLKEKEIIKISEILSKKSTEYNHDIYLLSDEPYRELIYNDIKYPFITNYYDNSIVCYSFSKSLSLPGERIGYVVINPKMNEAKSVYQAICGAGRALGFVCAPSLFQYLIPNCLGYTSDLNIYKNNRDKLYQELTSYGYEVVKPEGAFYLFMKALGDDAIEFSSLAKQYELLLVPSDSFGYSGYVRISYCVPYKQIELSLNAFKKLINNYNKRGCV